MLPDLKTSLLHSHRMSIRRYRGILATHLTALERAYVERHIEEEEAEIVRLAPNRSGRSEGPDGNGLEETGSLAVSRPNDDPVSELQFLCPHTNRLLNTGIVTAASVRTKISNNTIRLHCPHCGLEHSFEIEDALGRRARGTSHFNPGTRA